MNGTLAPRLRWTLALLAGLVTLFCWLPGVYAAASPALPTLTSPVATSELAGAAPPAVAAVSALGPTVVTSGHISVQSTFRPGTIRSPGILAATGVTVGTGFAGINSTTSACSCAPPDVQVAVGVSDVVEMVNLEGQVWTKTGSSLTSFTLAKFFGTGNDFISDPKVIYDNSSGRWFASLVDVSSGTTHVAVSTTGNPTKSWDVYVVPTVAGFFPDQPILGVNTGLVAIGGNVFNTSTSVYAYGELWALNKTSMEAGLTTYFNAFHNTGWFSMHPVTTLSRTKVEFVVMTSGTGTLDLFKLTGSPSALTSAHLSKATALSLTSFSTAPSAPQKGTTDKIDTGDARVQSAVWRGNVLWTTFNTGCVPSGDTATRACVRLVEVTTGTTPAVAQDFNLAKSGSYLFYAALSMDGSGNLGVVYGTSSATTHAAIYATGQLHGAAKNSHLAPTLLKAGTRSATVACSSGVCRWGDYYGAGADPKGPSLWVAGEFVGPKVFWATWIASIRV